MERPNSFKSFDPAGPGVPTVDWVVLAAALTGLAIVVMSTVSPSIDTTAARIGAAVEPGRH
ncbi:MAG: hypothetical protein LBE86_12970 [Gemmobacter sp.]|jgi:hypothetical protein|nr:hypothetical protein [Gemmobacter sp.]